MAPPADNAEVLDRTKMEERFQVKALEVPARRTGEFMKKLSQHLLNLPRHKNVEPVPGSSNSKLILMSRTLKDLSELPPAEHKWLQEQIEQAGVKVTSFDLCLGYDHFTAEEILRKILPKGMDIPSSYEQAGHVCHLNLRDSQLPFRYIIGQVILDKNKSVRTVVNKTGKIETEFRTFPMEHLAGDPSTVIRLKEHQCWFEFEYRDVYWNSRLQEEHGRLIEALFLRPLESHGGSPPVLADCTCGIGPFSIPIVKQAHGVVSHANDLNPASVHWLTRNAEINKLPHVDSVTAVPEFGAQFSAPDAGSRLVIHPPGDARVFVPSLFSKRHPVTHAIFNLPAMGVELLDCFRGLNYAESGLPTPLVCCYTFSDAAVGSEDEDGCVADLLRRVSAALAVAPETLSYAAPAERGQLPLPSPQIEEMVRLATGKVQVATSVAIRLVRNVAPSRHMFCVCFCVPVPQVDAGSDGPSEKRLKVV